MKKTLTFILLLNSLIPGSVFAITDRSGEPICSEELRRLAMPELATRNVQEISNIIPQNNPNVIQ